jgi:hypothetical protein
MLSSTGLGNNYSDIKLYFSAGHHYYIEKLLISKLWFKFLLVPMIIILLKENANYPRRLLILKTTIL